MTIGSIVGGSGSGPMPPCSHCGSALPKGARFCPGCGVALTGVQPGNGLVLEKRQATVLHCDLANSVVIGKKLGLEDYHHFLDSVLECIRTAVYRFRSRTHGRYDRTVGDSVLFCFGLPVAGERDAELAIEAALAARDAIRQIPVPPGITFNLHFGVATDEIVARMNPPPGDSPIEVTGLAPNLAARLQKCVSLGGIALSDSTRVLVEKRFRCKDLGVFDLPGVGPTRVWELLKRRVGPIGPTGGDTTGAPFVGREPEIASLRAAWDATSPDVPQVALLAGEPGVGKSRLAAEFVARLSAQSAFVVTLRCSQTHRHTPFHPVIAHLERALRLPPRSRPAARRSRLFDQVVHGYGVPQDAFPYLEELLNATPGVSPPASPDEARTRRNRAIDTVLDILFARLRSEAATVVLVEDVHWADASTLEVIRRAIAYNHQSRVLFLLTARPEVGTEVLAGIAARPLDLAPLSAAQSAILVARMDREHRLSPAAVEQIVSKCDGVPLYLEQVMLSLLEVLEDASPVEPVDDIIAAALEQIPLTLRDLLMSRLDRSRLGREVAQVGAAIGRVFSRELLFAVSTLAPEDNEQGILDLMSAGLVEEVGPATERSYSFRHAMIQDVAYDSLLRTARRELHRRIADALSSGHVPAAECTPEVIARHYTEADLPQPAVQYWRLAGAQAVERSANVEAIKHFSRAIRMTTRWADSDAAKSVELELRAALMPALLAANGYAAPDVVENIERARTLFPFSRSVAHRFVFPRAECQWAIVRAEYGRAMNIALELTGLAEEEEGSSYRLDAYLLRGLVEMYRGDLHAARASLLACCDLYDAETDAAHALRQGVDIESAAPAYLSRALWLLGETQAAEQAAARAVQIARRSPITLAETQASCMKMLLHLTAGDIENTRLWADRTAAVATQRGQIFWIRLVRIVWAWVNTLDDTTPAAAREIDRCLQDYQATGARLGISWFLLLRADAEQRSGQGSKALATVEEAEAFANSSEERYYLPEILRRKGELLWLLKGDLDEADASFVAALDTARRQSSVAWRLKAACTRAEVLFQCGAAPKAIAILESEVRAFTGDDGPYVLEATALLERLSR